MIRLPLLTSIDQLWSVTAIAILGGAQLLLLLSLLGCYLRSQAQTGLMGAVMALGSLIAGSAIWYRGRNVWAQLYYGILLPQSLAIQWSYGDKLGQYTDHELVPYRWIAMGLSLPVLASIGHLFVTRYGALRGSSTPVKRRRFRIALPPILSRIPIRLPGRLPAMIWLELRQSMPLAAFGFLLGVLMSISSVLIEHRHRDSFDTSVLMDLPVSMFVVAMLWAIVVGYPACTRRRSSSRRPCVLLSGEAGRYRRACGSGQNSWLVWRRLWVCWMESPSSSPGNLRPRR